MNNKRCVLLPAEIGEGVIKIQLDNNSSETARAILFVPPNSCVYNHSHEKNMNPDSEVYINLSEMINKCHNSTVPEVAGSNSPTGKTVHGIEKKDYFQVILAIKRGQEEGMWKDLGSDFVKYFQNLNVRGYQNENIIKIISNGTGKNEEFVTIDTIRNTVSYFSQKQQEFVNLDILKNSRDKELPTEEKVI